MTLSEAIDRVGKLLDGFPHGRPSNQKSYIGALANVLCQYPRMVAAKCADPLNGVARDTKFLPTIADLVGWCERESEFLRRQVERQDFTKTGFQQAKERAEEDVKLGEARKARPSYADLKAKYGENWGIGKNAAEHDRIAGELRTARIREANDTFLLREYAAAGEAPTDAGHGLMVSRELRDRIAVADNALNGARMRRAKEIGREADKLAAREAAE